jgi:hypothetical protein
MTPCLACGAPSTLLCDYHLGAPIGGEERGCSFIDASKMPFTCDMPLCKACATPGGWIHISGRDPFWDTFDYCPIHSDGNYGLAEPIESDVAESLRRKAWAPMLRGKMHIIDAARNGGKSND